MTTETTTLTNKGDYDGLIVKYNAEGEEQWAKSLGGEKAEYLYSVSAAKDGGYIIGGLFYSDTLEMKTTTLTNKGSDDGLIIKYNTEDEEEWIKSIGGSSNDCIYSVIETRDEGYIASGFYATAMTTETDSLKADGGDEGFIIKYDKKGEEQWVKSIGGSYSDQLKCVVEMNDGEIVAAGTSSSKNMQIRGRNLENKGYKDAFIVKFQEKEIPTVYTNWVKQIGEDRDEKIYTLAKTKDGGYIVGGYFWSDKLITQTATLVNKGNNYNGFIIKYDSQGKEEFAKNFGGTSQIVSAVGTQDGGYLIGGYFYSSSITTETTTLINKGKMEGFIIKYNAVGQEEWAKAIGGTDNDKINSVTITKDGGYIVGGDYSSNTITTETTTLTNKGIQDGFIIKYNSKGEEEWTKSIGNSGTDQVKSVIGTDDGGFVVGGGFDSTTMITETTTLTNKGNTDTLIIKYNSKGEEEWVKSIGGANSEQINAIATTQNGDYIVAGEFDSVTIETETSKLVKVLNDDVFIIKYNDKGEEQWAKSMGGSSNEFINSVRSTSDGGYIVGGHFYSSELTTETTTLVKQGIENGFVIKYDSNDKEEWAKEIGEKGDTVIFDVDGANDGSYIAVGNFGKTLEEGKTTLTSKGITDGLLLKITPLYGAAEQSELEVVNNRKEFKITTDVKEIDGIKGGSISGEDRKPYETVKYGETSTQEIKMIPKENYEIIGITVNGEEYPFEKAQDGSYIMPAFTNMQEDKHIVVTYSLKDNKITINKVDKETNEKLKGATFKLDQIEEREAPINVVGTLNENSSEYYVPDETNEITGVLGTLTENGTYYFVEQEGKLYPTNSKTYQVANVEGATQGVQSSTANSYIDLDLSEKEGKYVAVINAEVSSESSDYGYATITTPEATTPIYTTSAGRFMYISGTKAAQNYISASLDGGSVYRIHLGYRKDGSADKNDDQVVINSIKVYGAQTARYNFIENEGKYESTNQGVANTTSNSYIPIDLSRYTGKYNLTVNAQVSSQSSDYGYATVTETDSAPSYSSSTGRFIYISGTTGTNTEPNNYTTVLDGGKLYYLHLGYYKNGDTNEGEDKFTVNSIEVTLNDSELYHTEVTTNSEGQAITQIPFGKYAITEIKAPDGYNINGSIPDIEFRSNDGAVHEFTVEDEKTANIIVHHYLKDENGTYTETKVAEDERKEGAVGEEYSTEPRLDLERYELEKDTNGDYVLPDNATGTFKKEVQEVIYYYQIKEIPLTVNHYIEGTNTPVPLSDGSSAQSTKDTGLEGENYTTNALTQAELNEKYELVGTPTNANGEYEYSEIIVNYYYKVKKVNVKTRVEGTGGSISGQNEEIYETVEYAEDSTKEIKAVPEDNYYVKKITVNGQEIEFTENTDRTVTLNNFINMKEDKEVVVTFEKISATVIVHHYIEEADGTKTTTKVPSKVQGQVVEDETKTGSIGDIYVTKPAENAAEYYVVSSEPENASGEMTENTIEVTYYYKYVGPIISSQKEVATENGLDYVVDGEKLTYTIKIKNEGQTAKQVTLKDTIPTGTTFVAGSIKLNGVSATNTAQNLAEGLIINVPAQEGNTPGEAVLSFEVKADKAKLGKTITQIKNKALVDETYTNETVNEYKRPATVIVHHYLEGTQVKLANDETINGVVSQSYTTHKSSEVSANYTCVNETPEKYAGTIEEDTIEVTYYYRLNNETVTNSIEKTAKASKTVEETEVLTKEDEPVQYTIKYVTEIKDYIGKAKVTIVDTLPEEIDEEKSDLKGGTYNSTNKTITWEEIVNGIDTYANGTYNKEITKEISIVYKNQDVTKDLENTAKGTTVTYYPDVYSENAGKEKTKVEKEDTATVEQEYKTEKEVQKVWEDNENIRQKRPAGVNIWLTANNQTTLNGEELEKVVLSDENSWKYTFRNLEKYDTLGREIEYSVVESEVNENDLEYYEEAEIRKLETGKILVTNNYKLLDTALDSKITKEGTEKITSSKDEVSYNINYNATVEDYIGEIALTIVDTLPYKIDEEKSTLDGGTYDEETKTITWRENLGHINTDKNGEYVIEREKAIKVVYTDIDLTQEKMTNEVKAKLEFTETDQKNEVETSYDTQIDVNGKVIVKYVDKDTNEEITFVDGEEEKTYGYTINGKVGDSYETEQKEIPCYTYVESTTNTNGKVAEEDTEVIYYYTKTPAEIIVKYVDEEGNEIIPEEKEDGHVGDPYKREPKEIENYDYEKVTGKEEGNLTEEPTIIIYHYKKVPTKVVVKYLEKDTEKVLSEETTIEGNAGDNYETTRKEIENYQNAEPEPQNKKGKMTRETIYVIYYYEKIPSGTITVRYVDVETNEDIPYKDENGEEKTYNYELSGYVGEEYHTEEKEIPYYKLVEEKMPKNKDGKYKKEDDTIIYYYTKLPFNIAVEKSIKQITVNGENKNIKEGSKLSKLEIVSSKLKQAEVLVTYRILVTNTGEIEGKTDIIENIPSGYEVASSNPKCWKAAEGQKMETTLELKPKETKELEVVLKWNNSEANLGTQKNIVQLSNMENPAGYEDINENDNISEAEVLISIKTGEDIIKETLTIISIILVTGMLAVVSITTAKAYKDICRNK